MLYDLKLQIMKWYIAASYFAALALGHSVASEAGDRQSELDRKWSFDWGFAGVLSFAHLPHVKCLTNPDEKYDIAIVGAPFDTTVSYRPGARFGPRALRAASARQTSKRGYNARANLNPYDSWAKIIDCGDMPITPFDNALALRQMTEGFLELGQHSTLASALKFPKLVTLGGDHSIALPTLRALFQIYKQPITVLHFDAHLDTWSPEAYDNAWLDKDIPAEQQQSSFTHGSMFWLAWKEGLIANQSVHAGLRTRLSGVQDNEGDTQQGWVRVASDDISADELGPKGIAKKIMDTIGTERPVYLSVDIDVIDPGLAPGTGTPEPGGWSTRELVQVLRRIEGLNVIAADLVEVSPGYDGAGEQTALAGAQVIFELLTSMVKRGLLDGYGISEAEGILRDEL